MNIFGDEFYRLYKAERVARNFFVDYVVELGGNDFVTVEYVPTNDILNNCYKIAREKAMYTMAESQSSQKRDYKQKVINQFKGIMAESAIHIFLMERCGFPIEAIKRWDLERNSFRSADSEYDLRIDNGGESILIESRSSSSYCRLLKGFILENNLIGKYSSEKKHGEKTSDIYVQPVFQYENPSMTSDEYLEAISNTFDDIAKKRLKLYLVACAGKKDMFGPKGYQTSLGQGKTQYRCMHIRDAYDMTHLLEICKKERSHDNSL